MSNNQDAATFDAALDKEESGLAVVQGHDYVQHERIPQRSHSCCKCCCDTRRAVIVVNIISMTFAALAVLSISILANTQYAAQLDVDDDELQAALDEMDGAALGITIGVAVIGMICNACGIFGAYKFHKISTVISGLWYFAQCIRACYNYDLAGLVIDGFFMYPHVVFYQEVSNGIMSPASYPQEQRSCNCCV
jgi:hypothetical protein